MITILICSCKEDGQLIKNVVGEYIAYYSSQDWEFNCCEGVDEAQACSKEKANLDFIFLDITKESAISFAETVRKKFPNMVLHVIADDSISPMSYLKPSIMPASLILRPFDDEQLHKSVQEVIQYAFKEKCLEEQEEDCFVIDSNGDRIRISYSTIVYFEARERKIFVLAGVKEYGFYSTMENLENDLPDQFVRCHRSFIFNMNRAQELRLTQNTIIMDDGSRVPLSRGYRNVIKEKME
ncbi:LytR/AlgR family response regulator transcription factor [Anaerosporobacter sp.]